MQKYSLILLRFSAVFALIGTFIGAHLAGSGSYAMKPIHAHILVVGWLTLFAWSVYYKIYRIKAPKLAGLQVWTAIIGTTALTGGMWIHFLDFNLPKPLTLGVYIGGGTVLLVSFVIFLVTTFFIEQEEAPSA